MTKEQQDHLQGIIKSVRNGIRAKYEKGQAEHGGNLWEKPGILEMAIDEAFDLSVYLLTLQSQKGQKMKVAYLAGKYTENTKEKIQKNIDYAEDYAVKYLKLGYAVICPHKNYAFFENKVGYETLINADFELIKRADVIVFLPNWKESKGAMREHEFAKQNEIARIYEIKSPD
jgi:hypothetical protein